MQATLFGDEIEAIVKPEAKDTLLAIKIIGSKDKILSKSETMFNSLVKRIDYVSKQIVVENEKLECLLQYHGKEVIPHQNTFAEANYNAALILDMLTQKNKYSNRQLDKFGEVIAWHLSEMFAIIPPDDKMKALYDKWATIGFDEEAETFNDTLKNAMSETINNMFGIDIDFSEFDDSPEGMAKMQEKLNKIMEENAEQEYTSHASKRKSKKNDTGSNSKDGGSAKT